MHGFNQQKPEVIDVDDDTDSSELTDPGLRGNGPSMHHYKQ